MPFLGTTGGGSVKQYGGQANLGYFIKNSLRFRKSNSAYLSRTMGSTSTTYTISVWVKRGLLSGYQYIFASGPNTASDDKGIAFDTSTNKIYAWNGSGQALSTAVFRDPAAWYHVVMSVNSGTATVYVNNVNTGISQTSMALGTNGRIGRFNDASSANDFDGYMAEFNLIDGQALTPSSFGKTDAATNQWIPKKFAGTYGTNGFYLKFADASAATAAAIGKDSSPNGNNWTPNNIDLSSPTTIRSYTTTGSSTWIAPVGVTSVNYLVVAGGGAGGSAGPTMYDSGSGGGGAGGVANGSLVIIPGTSYTLTVGTAGTGTSGRTRGANGSNSVFATITAIGGGGGAPGAAGNDGAAGGSGGGSSVSGTGGAATPGQGFAGGSSTTSSGAGGGGAGGAGSASPNNRGGDGGAGFPSSISGSPVTYAGGGGGGAYSGSPGPGGSGGSSIGGAGGVNNASGSNATGYGSGGGGSGGTYNTTGTLSGGSGSSGIVILSYTSPTSNTYDAMIDSPTLSAVASNYCVMNPLDTNTITMSNGNLKTTTSGTDWTSARASFGVSSGKWYWEYTINDAPASSKFTMVGIASVSVPLNSYIANAATGYGYNANDGQKYNSATAAAYGAAFTTNDVIGVALDMDTGTLTFYKNGISQGTAYSSLSGTFLPAISMYVGSGSMTTDLNFGQRAFTYTPPTGFKSLNTFNLP